MFNIQPFSVYDGPGIRTTVFLKGCNLRCRWCHNPESLSPRPQVQFQGEKCIGCGECFRVCPQGAHTMTGAGHTIERDRCTGCGACAESCFAGALVMTGREMTAREVFERILEDEPYFKKSGGGVTFSGGEAMLQPAFLKELLTLCHGRGIHTAVDTAGNVPMESFREILQVTDLFLYDVKAFDSLLHKRLTGAYNGRILQNLAELLSLGAQVIVRVPCVMGREAAPGGPMGGNWDDLPHIAAFLSKLPVKRVELLAYHRLGEGKRLSLGLAPEPFTPPTQAQMEEALRLFTDVSVPAVYNR